MWLDVTYKGDAVSTNFLCEQKSARDLWTTKQHFCFCIYMHSQVSAIHKKWKSMTRVANALQITLWPSVTQCHDLSFSICQEWSTVSQNHSQFRCLCRQSHQNDRLIRFINSFQCLYICLCLCVCAVCRWLPLSLPLYACWSCPVSFWSFCQKSHMGLWQLCSAP